MISGAYTFSLAFKASIVPSQIIKSELFYTINLYLAVCGHLISNNKILLAITATHLYVFVCIVTKYVYIKYVVNTTK